MLLLLLFITGLCAGTVDAIAGGGGLISLPVLLSVGVPPHLAFGTNKFQGTVGTLMATRKYYQHGFISLAVAYQGILFGLLGGVLGAVTAQILSTQILYTIIPMMLTAILVYTFFSPKMGKTDGKARMKPIVFYMTIGFGLAFYDGFFGPGTGSFWVFVLTFLMGFNLIKATAYAKIFNLNSSFVSAICFAIGGNIDYRLGIFMAAGQLIGGRLGAHLAIKKGTQLIRPVFLTIVSLTVFSLVSKHYLKQDSLLGFYHGHPMLPLVVLTAMLTTGGLFYRRRLKRTQIV